MDLPNNSIELEGLSGDFMQIEKWIHARCVMAARRAVDDAQCSIQWVYYDTASNRPVVFGGTIGRQLELCYEKKQQGIVRSTEVRARVKTRPLNGLTI